MPLRCCCSINAAAAAAAAAAATAAAAAAAATAAAAASCGKHNQLVRRQRESRRVSQDGTEVAQWRPNGRARFQPPIGHTLA
jgi:hypothetical protein